MIQPQFFFQLLVILLHAPAQLRQAHQPLQRGLSRQVGKPVLGRSRFLRRPLDQQPHLFQFGVVADVTMGRLDPQSREAASLRPFASFSPVHLLPGTRRQRRRQPLQRGGFPFIAEGGRTALARLAGRLNPASRLPSRWPCGDRLRPHTEAGGPPNLVGIRCFFHRPRRPTRAVA